MTAISDPRGAQIVSVIAPASGAGRTSTVLNLGWILASAGDRVLVVDLDDEPPGAQEYLEPFHVDDARAGRLIGEPMAAELGDLVRAAWGLPGLTDRPGEDGELTVHRYSLPGGSAALDLVRIRLVTPNRATLAAGAEPQVGLRRALRRLQYEYILLDNPAPRQDEQPGLVSRLVLISDVVAVCFRPTGAELPRARQLAAEIQANATDRPRVIAVPTQLTGRFERGPEQALAQLRAAFPDMPVVPIPYRGYGYNRSLAVLLDDPADSRSPLAAYEQLTERVTDGAVDKLRPVSATVRRRFERALGLGDDTSPEHVSICYAPPDRPWAEWLQGQFAQVGLDVTLATGPPPGQPAPSTVVVVRSEHLTGSAAGEWYAGAAGTEVPYDLVAVWVDGQRGTPAGGGEVDLRMLTGERAQAELRSRLAMAPTGPPTGARWPGLGRGVPRTNLAASTKSFVGRRDELEAMREALLAGHVRLLTGEPGTGKSKLIREYVARYGHDYDFVWWLPADDPPAVRTGLAGLGEAMGAEPGGDPVAAALGELASTHRRWLLIFHNATDPAVVRDLLPEPSPRGHVLLTAPPGAWPDTGGRFEAQPIEPFSTAEGVRLLRRYVPELGDQDAAEVIATAGKLPIALRLVGSFLEETAAQFRRRAVPVADATSLAAQEFVRMHRSTLAADSALDPTAACLSVLLEAVVAATSRGRMALRLAELCSYLPPDGTALTLLTSPGMIGQLVLAGGAGDGRILATDAIELHRILHTAAEYSLFAVDWGTGAAVRMHRLMQLLVRAAMSPATRAERQAQVLRGLAAYAPTGAETDAAARLGRCRELAPYLETSGALDSTDRQVRTWLVQHVRYLFQEGDATAWRAALVLGERLLAAWEAAPTEPPDGQDLLLRLAVQVANLHRVLGDYQTARELDERILIERQGSAGLDHPRTLRAARGLGGDLRGLGRFRQAYGYDTATRAGFIAAYGRDHRDTLRATNNAALSAYLVGSLETAMEDWTDLADRYQRLLGEGDPAYWNTVARVGMCLRDAGRYDAAWHQLREAQAHLVKLRPPDHIDALRVKNDVAVTERMDGQYGSALHHQIEVLGRMSATLGEDHPETRAARLALAADHLGVGNRSGALTLGRRCLEWYTDRFGADHPFTQVCEVDLAVFEYADDDAAAALERGTRAARALAGQTGDDAALGRTHPWTLAAELNRGVYLAATGERAEAVARTERILVRCVDSLGPEHPYTRAAQATLALLRGSGPPPGPSHCIHLEIPRV